MAQRTHVAGIDGLRALAIVAVLLFHADVPGLDGGYLGVDLFFVISGWLITTLLLDEIDRSGRVDVLAFWGRRMRRLLPAVLVLIGAVVVWWAMSGPAEQQWAVREDAPFALFYVANWHEIATSGNYWATTAAPSPLTHLWSLAIEEQFYVVWPVVLLALTRLVRRQWWITAVCAALAVASFMLLRRFYVPQSPMRSYMGTDTRAAAILIGAALATAPARRVATRAMGRLGPARSWLMAACVVALFAFWHLGGVRSVPWILRGGLLFHSVIGAVLVVAVATWQRGWVVGVLANPVLQWIGARSYSLYLWHWPVYVWLDEQRTGLDGPALLATRLGVSVLFAEASYRLVESPVRWRFAWARRPSGAFAGGLAMVTVAGVVAMTPAPPPLAAPRDLAGTLEQIGRSDRPTTSVGVSQVQGFAVGLVMRNGVAGAPPPPQRTEIDSVLWMGDSIAFDETPGVTAALSGAGLELFGHAFPGASLTGHAWMPEGQTWLTHRYPGVLASNDADVVVWQLSRFDAPAAMDANILADTAFVEMALRDHAAVVFVTPPPMRTGAVPGVGDEDWTDLEEAARLVAHRYPGRVFVADAAAVWGAEYRRHGPDGTPLRKPDGIHVCPLGAAMVGSFVAGWLAAHFDGVTPTDPVWWRTSWWTDARYDNPRGVCTSR